VIGVVSAAETTSAAGVAVVKAWRAAVVVATNPCTPDSAVEAVTADDGRAMLDTAFSTSAAAFCTDGTTLGNDDAVTAVATLECSFDSTLATVDAACWVAAWTADASGDVVPSAVSDVVTDPVDFACASMSLAATDVSGGPARDVGANAPAACLRMCARSGSCER
jgi:hypothetical protein